MPASSSRRLTFWCETRTVCAVAVVTLGLAAFYAAHVYYFLARRIADRELLLSFMGLAVLFRGGHDSGCALPRVDHGELGNPGRGDALAGGQAQEHVSQAGRVSALRLGLAAVWVLGPSRPVLGARVGDSSSCRRIHGAPARAFHGLWGADRLDRGRLLPAQVTARTRKFFDRRGQRCDSVAGHAVGAALFDNRWHGNGVPLSASRVEPQSRLSLRAMPATATDRCSGSECAC